MLYNVLARFDVIRELQAHALVVPFSAEFRAIRLTSPTFYTNHLNNSDTHIFRKKAPQSAKL